MNLDYANVHTFVVGRGGGIDLTGKGQLVPVLFAEGLEQHRATAFAKS